MRSFFATVALVSFAAAQTFDEQQYAYEASDSVYSTTSQGADWDNGTCATGTAQSPINLTTAGASNNDVVAATWTADETYPQVNYSNDNGGVSWSHTFQAAISDRSSNNKVVVTDFEGTETTHHLRNMRVRSPSEHTIDGKNLPAELQVYFTDETDGTHVLSYFIEIAADDSEDLTTFLASTTEYEGWFVLDDDEYSEFNFAELLTFSSNFWTYTGSLTDEDCDEGVNWTVFKEFLYITEGQLDVLQSRILADVDTYNGNNRVVQEGDRIADITVYQDNDTYEISAFEDYVFVDETQCTADVEACAEEEEVVDDGDEECEEGDEDCEDDDDGEDEECEEGDEDCEDDEDDEDDDDDDSETPDAAFSLAASTAAIAMAAVIAF